MTDTAAAVHEIPTSLTHHDSVDQFMFLKYLTHTWELEGEARIGRYYSDVGAFAIFHIPFLKEAVASMSEDFPDLLSVRQANLLSDLLRNGIDRNPNGKAPRRRYANLTCCIGYY